MGRRQRWTGSPGAASQAAGSGWRPRRQRRRALQRVLRAFRTASVANELPATNLHPYQRYSGEGEKVSKGWRRESTLQFRTKTAGGSGCSRSSIRDKTLSNQGLITTVQAPSGRLGKIGPWRGRQGGAGAGSVFSGSSACSSTVIGNGGGEQSSYSPAVAGIKMHERSKLGRSASISRG